MSLRAFKKPWFLFILLVVLVAGGWVTFRSDSVRKLDHPEYLSFVGQYVFSVPKDYAVDEQAIQGLQIVLSTKTKLAGKTIDEVYADNNITLQPAAFLKDKKGDSFKKYVDETLVPQIKQKLSADVASTFSKSEGLDTAVLTAKKDGKPLRFIYLKSGLHPVSIVSKEETDAFKKLEQSITDVEKTDLKNEIAPLKKAVENTAKLLRDKNAAELYKQAAPDLRSKNTQDQITKLLAAEEVYSQGAEVINGGSYDNNEFGGVIYFIPLNTDFKPSSGALYFQKIDDQWKLKGLQLPNPATNQVKS
ncbi:MAG: hypothetical protein Q7R60_03750 [bacterium]|nr:hypothetical protein [bacterium]